MHNPKLFRYIGNLLQQHSSPDAITALSSEKSLVFTFTFPKSFFRKRLHSLYPSFAKLRGVSISCAHQQNAKQNNVFHCCES